VRLIQIAALIIPARRVLLYRRHRKIVRAAVRVALGPVPRVVLALALVAVLALGPVPRVVLALALVAVLALVSGEKYGGMTRPRQSNNTIYGPAHGYLRYSSKRAALVGVARDR